MSTCLCCGIILLQGDLAAVTQFLQTHISDMDAKRAPQPDWATVRYMVASIQYAGRITDDFDRILMVRDGFC